MTIKIWKDFTKNGYVFASYSFICSIGIINAVVLCHLIAEYNHAYNKKLNLCNWFLSDLRRMAQCLEMDEMI